jgi:signal transduction histidine kinase
MPARIQVFLIIPFSIIILSSFILSNIAISNIKNEIKNYSSVLSNTLSSSLMLGSEDVENILKNIPFAIIITDDKDSIRFYKGFNKMDNLYKIKENLKIRHQFSEIIYEGVKIGRIYYTEPSSIFYLSILPFILMLITIITFIIIVLAIRNVYNYEAEKFYSTFAKGLAHQMGTPISSLIANIELLKRGEDRFYEIENDLNRITSILKRFSKIGSGINFKEFSINEAILNASNRLKDRFSRDFDIFINGNAKVKGDFELFEWVFENFIKNSYEANSSKVCFEIIENKKNYIIDIINDGFEISPKLSKKLFSKNITTKAEGWGIGLVLVNRIIQMHKGKVKLLESKNNFTKFRIILPKL